MLQFLKGVYGHDGKQNNMIKAIVFIILLITIQSITAPIAGLYLLYVICKVGFDPKEREYRRRAQQHFIDAKLQEAQNPVHCPQCQSEQIAAVNQRSGFRVEKAIAGELVARGIGTLAGFIGNNKNKIMCMKCGHVWKP